MKQYLNLELSKKCLEKGLTSESGMNWFADGTMDVHLVPWSVETKTYPAFEMSDFLNPENAKLLWGDKHQCPACLGFYDDKDTSFCYEDQGHTLTNHTYYNEMRHELIDGDWLKIVEESLNERV